MYSNIETYKKINTLLKNHQYDEIDSMISQGLNINQENDREENFLWKAIVWSDLELFLWLNNKKLSLTKVNIFNETILLKIIETQNIEMLNEYLKHEQSNINHVSNKGLTPLIQACIVNNKEIVDILIKHGANVNQQNHHGNTALMVAITKSDIAIVDSLLNENIDLGIQNNNGETAFIVSMAYKKIDVINMLLNKVSVDIINIKNNYGTSAVSYIAKYRDAPEDIFELLIMQNVIQKFIDMNADFNVPTFGSRTSSPLLEIVKIGYIPLFESILIKIENIDLGVIDSDGNDILHYLTINGQITSKLLSKILQSGYDINNIQSNMNISAYDMLRNIKDNKEVENIILILKDIYKMSKEKNLNFICSLLKDKNESLMKIMIKHKILNIKNIDKEKNSLLHYLYKCIGDNEKIGMSYIELDIQKNEENCKSITDSEYLKDLKTHIFNQKEELKALKNKIKNFVKEILSICINEGIDIDVKNINNDTPLMKMIELSDEIIIKEFVKYNPDILISNDYGENSLCLSIKNDKANLFKEFFLNKESATILQNILINLVYNIPENWYDKNTFINGMKRNIYIFKNYLNYQDENGNTAIIISSALNEKEVAEILINEKCNINIQNYKGETALMHAVKNKNISLIKLLINNGAFIYTKNNDGLSVFELTNDENILNML